MNQTRTELHTPLINLALLETLKGENINDEIDLFVPYTAIIINKLESESFCVSDVKQGFKREFGITPPESALLSILTRTKKRKLISLNHGRYFKNHRALSELSQAAESKRTELEDSLNRVLIEFQKFANEKHEKQLSTEETENFLYKFLTANLSTFIGSIGGKRSEIETKIRNTEYLTASFIKTLFETSSPLTSDISIIVKGIILSNYISYADKTTNKKSLSNITLFLDTPIVLGILGYSGHSKEVALKEFLDLILSLEIKTTIFDITFDEIQKLFHVWGSDLERGNYNRFNTKTLELLRARGIDKARLETESALLESTIGKLGIDTITDFKWEEKYNCDFAALEQHLRRKGFENNLGHDVNCAARAFNIRAGRKVTTLNEKLGLFVTLNTTFERAANSYLINELPRGSIPVVISERLLSTVLWLKNPSIHKNLPSKILLANAYSTIYSDDKFWHSFITRLEQIKKRGEITEDDFLLVRWDKSLLDRVHDASIDTGTEFEDSDIFDIVESIKEKNQRESNEHIEKITTNAASAIIEKDEEIALKSQKIDEQDNRIRSLNSHLLKLSSLASHVICIAISSILIALTSYGIIKALPPSSINLGSSITLPDEINSFSVILLLTFTLLSLICGFTFKSAYTASHKALEDIIFRKLTPPN